MQHCQMTTASYSVWYLVTPNTMKRWPRHFKTRQAARQAAVRAELVAFRVLKNKSLGFYMGNQAVAHANRQSSKKSKS